MEKVDCPDHSVVLPVSTCCCSADLSQIAPAADEVRQVFELPKPKLEVMEFKGDIKTCPVCNLQVKASFPDSVSAPDQYGERFRFFLVYLHHQQLLPVGRIHQMMRDLFNAPVCEATIFNASKRSYENLQPFEKAVVQSLIESPVVQVDESGVRTAGKLHWLHVACTEHFTRIRSYISTARKQSWNILDAIPRPLPVHPISLLHLFNSY